MTGHFMEVSSDEVVDMEMEQVIPEPPPTPEGARKKVPCGATALRLNLDLNRLYGKWYPTDASDSAYLLWMTSLYGRGREASTTPRTCISMDIQAGPEENTLNVELSQKAKRTMVQAALLEDSVHPGRSKWVMSWPNGEDTLTSIVATGSVNSETSYDWMLTVDCDLSASTGPDWAIFAREGGLSAEATGAVMAILDGISESLRLSKVLPTKSNNCTSDSN